MGKVHVAVTKHKANESVASTDYFDMHGAIVSLHLACMH